MVWVPEGGRWGVPLGKSTVKFFHRRTAFRLINWCTVGELGEHQYSCASSYSAISCLTKLTACYVGVRMHSFVVLLCIGGLIAVTASSSSFLRFASPSMLLMVAAANSSLRHHLSSCLALCRFRRFVVACRHYIGLRRASCCSAFVRSRRVGCVRTDVRVLSFRFALFLFHTLDTTIKKFFLLLFLEC